MHPVIAEHVKQLDAAADCRCATCGRCRFDHGGFEHVWIPSAYQDLGHDHEEGE